MLDWMWKVRICNMYVLCLCLINYFKKIVKNIWRHQSSPNHIYGVALKHSIILTNFIKFYLPVFELWFFFCISKDLTFDPYFHNQDGLLKHRSYWVKCSASHGQSLCKSTRHIPQPFENCRGKLIFYKMVARWRHVTCRWSNFAFFTRPELPLENFKVSNHEAFAMNYCDLFSSPALSHVCNTLMTSSLFLGYPPQRRTYWFRTKNFNFFISFWSIFVRTLTQKRQGQSSWNFPQSCTIIRSRQINFFHGDHSSVTSSRRHFVFLEAYL